MRILRKPLLVALAVVVAVLALSLRLRAVERLPIDFDEDDYLRAAQQIAVAIQNSDFNQLLNLNYRTEHPQLAKLVYGLSIVNLGPSSEIPDLPTSAPPAQALPEPQFTRARLTGVVLNVAAVFTLALLDPIAGLFFAVHTYTIKYTSQVMLESLPMLTSLLCVVFYTRSRRKVGIWLILAGIMLGLTAASKYIYCVVGIGILIDWLESSQPDLRTDLMRRFKPILVWGLIGVGTFFLVNLYLWPDPFNRLVASITYHGGYIQSQAVQEANLPFWQPFVWLFSSVPWHPGVFIVSLDLLVTIFATIGIRSLHQNYQVFFWWLIAGLIFLLIWPTKWAQYSLIITAPLALSAALGVRGLFAAARKFLAMPRKFSVSTLKSSVHDLRIAFPWLLPGLLLLALIEVYPLFYQAAMALTDFSSGSIRDGLNGGIWREVWLGLTGQVEPVQVEFFQFNPSRTVHYAGPSLLLGVLSSFEGASLLVFEILWTVLSVSLQTILGLTTAIVLDRYLGRFRKFWLAIFILPWAIPEFVGVFMWLQILDPRFGWFVRAQAEFSQRLDFPTKPILPAWGNDPGQALLYLLLPAVWYGFPFMMLAASAGLKLIPNDVYEAAAIDGASSWQRFMSITWPLLFPLLIPAIIIRMIFAFNQFYIFVTFQAPFPVSTFATTSYNFFAEGGAYALSAVLNIVTIIVLIIGILFFNRLTRATSGLSYAN